MSAVQVGSRVVVLDPSLEKLVEPTGTIVEVRCDGGRVKVQHDSRGPKSMRVPGRTGPMLAACLGRCRQSGKVLQHRQRRPLSAIRLNSGEGMPPSVLSFRVQSFFQQVSGDRPALEGC